MRQTTITLLGAAIVLTAILFSGCLADKGELIADASEEFCDSLQANYNDDAKTIIDASCSTGGVACHGQSSGNGDFTSYASLEARQVLTETGIVNRINATDASIVMPPGNTLSQEEKDILTCWANDGYPEAGQVAQDPCENIDPTYTNDAKTIIDNNCATSGCHSAGANIGDFTSYTEMQARQVLNAQGIVDRINSSNPGTVMPPGNTLSQEAKDILTCWANDGYPE